MIERGVLALIVGPSGVGKDSLIARARTGLATDPHFCFPRRAVTRPAIAGPEHHIPFTTSEFETAEAHGAFLLSWRAHGTAYGIPEPVLEDLEQDRVVIANVSRAVIKTAEALVRATYVIHVTAPRDVLLQRLAERGREPLADIEQRLERTLPLPPTRAPVIEIDNSGSLDTSAPRFIQALLHLAQARADSVR